MCGQHIKRIYKLKTQGVVNASGKMHTFSMHTVRRKMTEFQKMSAKNRTNRSTKLTAKVIHLSVAFVRLRGQRHTLPLMMADDISSPPDECVDIFPTWSSTWLKNYSHRREGGK